MVLNSLTGDLLQESLQACAEFGTFVEITKRNILDNTNLNMRVFERGITFTAFDLSDLFWSVSEEKHQVWSRYLLFRSL